MLSDQLNFSQKCTKTSSVDGSSQDTAVHEKNLNRERERERERANFSSEREVVENSQNT